MIIGRCPPIDKLEQLLANERPRVERHVSKCPGCDELLAVAESCEGVLGEDNENEKAQGLTGEATDGEGPSG